MSDKLSSPLSSSPLSSPLSSVLYEVLNFTGDNSVHISILRSVCKTFHQILSEKNLELNYGIENVEIINRDYYKYTHKSYTPLKHSFLIGNRTKGAEFSFVELTSQDLDKLPNVEKLLFDSSNINFIPANNPLRYFLNLTTLSLYCCNFTGIECLSLPNLQHLQLQAYEGNLTEFNQLFKNLVSFKLVASFIKDADLVNVFRKCQRLENLMLFMISNISSQPFFECPQTIKKMDLSLSTFISVDQIDGEGLVDFIRKSTQLRYICLFKHHLSSNIMRELRMKPEIVLKLIP